MVEVSQIPAVDIAATTTSSSLGRVRGFTVELLRILDLGPLRTAAICQKTQKTVQYVETYLNRMTTYDLTMKTGSFWNLTATGESFCVYLKREDEFLRDVKERKKESKHLHNTTTTTTTHSPHTILKKVQIQAQFALWLHENPLSDVEKGVVDYLVSHYNRTRQKFIIVGTHYELAQRLNVNPEAIKEAMKKLYQDRVAYCVRWQGSEWKIGLYKAFVEGLEKAGT